MVSAFIHGYLLSFGLILPLGPQNVFVFSQGATQPKLRRALPAAIAAAICDTLLIVIAVLGVSTIVLTVPWIKLILSVIGVGFLTYIVWMTWRSDGGTPIEQAAHLWPIKRQIVFAMSVSLLNPHAILDTIGVIGTSSLAYVNADRFAFTLACVINSWLWFFALAVAGRFLSSFEVVRKWLNSASAVIMWLSAIYLVYNLARVA
jgi:L-lysine exporter family protein LysE/ArgO